VEGVMDDMVQRAKDLACRAHDGQVDKAGRPYIEHVSRVAAAVADDPEAEAVAWLHDVLEDCEFVDVRTLDSMFPPRIVGAVEALTRQHFSEAGLYYVAVASDPIALRVKLADIADNADESRLALLDEKTAARLRRKYAKARKALGVDE
jgi:(p)ppGpp synthase/HD superfamily hydrolase